MLCIESIGAPMSIVLMPHFAEMVGPIVEPHIPSCLMMNSWIGTGGFD